MMGTKRYNGARFTDGTYEGSAGSYRFVSAAGCWSVQVVMNAARQGDRAAAGGEVIV
jgi:hypothetical protein